MKVDVTLYEEMMQWYFPIASKPNGNTRSHKDDETADTKAEQNSVQKVDNSQKLSSDKSESSEFNENARKKPLEKRESSENVHCNLEGEGRVQEEGTDDKAEMISTGGDFNEEVKRMKK